MRIGLVLNILDEEYQISLYRGIKRRAAELGIQIICFQEGNTEFRSDAFIGRLPQKDFFNLDGIILLTSVVIDSCTLNNKTDIQNIWGELPLVSVGQKIDGVPSLLIQTDDSMRDLVDHLVLTHKYRNFIYIGGSQTHQDAINREQLFKKLMEQYKSDYPDIDYIVLRGNFTEQSAVLAMEGFMKNNPGKIPDAVVCANDNMAIGVYKFLKINNTDSFGNVAVTGFDDIPQGRYSIPALTTVHQPLDKIGEEAVNIIFDYVQQKTVPLEKSIGSSVIYRESCGCTKTEVDINAVRESFSKVQSSYVLSEQMLRIVSHVGQDLNNDNREQELVSIIDYNTAMLGAQDFCILKFPLKLSQSEPLEDNSLFVRPVFVRCGGKTIKDFPLNSDGLIKLCDFYDFINQKYSCSTLVFKFLNAGNDYMGCLLYDAPDNSLPYIILLSVDIALAMNRIEVNEERRRYADFLESEVSNRTRELVDANNRRMKVEAEVLKISEIERQRFSNDLHDDICQRLAGISMLCRSYSSKDGSVGRPEMEELAALVSDTLQRTRQYAHNSYPVDLENLGLDASLSNLCNSFELQSGIKCDYEWDIAQSFVFDKMQKLNIFRIIQEALHNVMKHSQAQKVIVRCLMEGAHIVFRVVDDGIGIGEKESSDFGIGLNSMQYRANQMDAAFKIFNAKPKGTCVEVVFEKAWNYGDMNE